MYNMKVTVIKRVTPEYIFDNNVPLRPTYREVTIVGLFMKSKEA